MMRISTAIIPFVRPVSRIIFPGLTLDWKEKLMIYRKLRDDFSLPLLTPGSERKFPVRLDFRGTQ
jgi:hypothetical protein